MLKDKILYALVTIGFCLQCTTNVQAQDSDLTVDEYIAMYKDMAIQEMERSGIPASITLAQGIHESAFGNSTLAKKANNHFGIKCANDWDGETYYKWDDDAQKSCFRIYDNAKSSYLDHTDLLLKRDRYAFLFKYDRRDYKSWAKGLRKAGYATDPNYPNKLIVTIEKNDLAQYDKATGTLVFDTELEGVEDILLSEDGKPLRTKKRSFLFTSYKAGFQKENGSSYAIGKAGESALAAAKRFGIPYSKFLRFNDLNDGDQLMYNQYIYLQPKKAKYKGSKAFHKVEKDETMYEIAQYYGVRLSTLYNKNLLEEGEEPVNGELILLKDKAAKKPKLRSKNHIDLQPTEDNPTISSNKVPLTTDNKNTTTQGQVKIPTVERPKPQAVVLNTPTYDSDVYADSSHINTATQNDSIRLKALENSAKRDQELTNNNPTTTVVVNNPYGNTTTTVVTNPVENATTTVVTNPVENTPTKVVDNQAIFGGSNSNSTTTNTNNNPYGNTSNPYENNTNPTTVYPNPNTTVVTNNPTNNTTTTIIVNNPTSVTHIVKSGDTLYSIFRKYNTPVDEIKKMNNLDSNVLTIGQQLKIPVQ